MEHGSVLPSYGHDNSLVNSDQYSNSYSDIPLAAGNNKELPEIRPYQGPILNNHQGQFSRSSSVSESMSSFSSDDDEEQSKPPRYNGRQLDSNRSGQFPRGWSESVSSTSNTNNNNSTSRVGTFPRSANMGLPVPQVNQHPSVLVSSALPLIVLIRP